MDKVDLKKELKELYSPSPKKISIVDVPDMNFLMIDGEGAPTSLQYLSSIQTLYPIAYTLKFMVKKATSLDYGVMPLEGLWWADDMTQISADRKDEWKWRSMIMQPKYVTQSDFKAALEQVKKKNLPAIDKVRFESFHEGNAVQILYVGPFSEEGATIQEIHAAIKASGHQPSCKHHEIYLNDPSRTAPEKLKTILRQPFT
jgi:hypothetical protein